jgi:hypothetical protein
VEETKVNFEGMKTALLNLPCLEKLLVSDNKLLLNVVLHIADTKTRNKLHLQSLCVIEDESHLVTWKNLRTIVNILPGLSYDSNKTEFTLEIRTCQNSLINFAHFFVNVGAHLTEVIIFIDSTENKFIDISILAQCCPNIKIAKLSCKFTQDSDYQISPHSFQKLEVLELYHAAGSEAMPAPVLVKMLSSKALNLLLLMCVVPEESLRLFISKARNENTGCFSNLLTLNISSYTDISVETILELLLMAPKLKRVGLFSHTRNEKEKEIKISRFLKRNKKKY